MPTAGEGEATVGEQTPVEEEEDEPKETDTKKPSGSGSKDEDEDEPSGSGSKKPTATKKATSIKIPNTAIAGSVAMKTPSIFEGFQIYKIGSNITLEWNYTGLIVTPAALHVVAWCKDSARDYTITANASGQLTKVIWDTGKHHLKTNLPM